MALMPWLPKIDPDCELIRVAQLAANMRTALWVDTGEQYHGHALDTLVATGQATSCYNMMLHLKERYGDPDSGELPADSDAGKLYQRLLHDFWEPLQDDPFVLVRDRKQGMPTAHVAECERGCAMPPTGSLITA